MTRLVLSLCAILPLVTNGQVAVTNLVLDPREVIVVPVATDRVTTIAFPTPISHIEAAYVAADDVPPSRFQLSFHPGNSFLSLRALGTNDRASMNIRWNGATYVFELVPSRQPLLALTLVQSVKPDSVRVRQAPSAQRLLAMVDLAKAYALLRSQQPAEVADIQYSPRRDRYDFGAYEVFLEEVFRFQTEDTLVFRVVVANRTAVPLNYLPQSFRVQVGERAFHSAICDGNGVVPPSTAVPIYFAVATAPDGSRPGLAIANQFMVLITVLPSSSTVAVPAQPIMVYPYAPPSSPPKRNLWKFWERQ